jgi:hypothetical protein
MAFAATFSLAGSGFFADSAELEANTAEKSNMYAISVDGGFKCKSK